MTDIEIWKDIKNYEGLYQVSNWGRVKSLGNGGTYKTSRILKTGKDINGYFFVTLWKNGKQKHCLVHRLVATAFLDNPENFPCINHKDEVKTNNSVENLEWCSYKYNNNYGSHKEKVSDAQINDPNKSKKVLQFTLDGELIREWESTRECERNGFNHCSVCLCCNGKLKSHKGFLWEYK